MSNSKPTGIRREVSSYNVARELLISINAHASVKKVPFDPKSVTIHKRKPRVFVDFNIDLDDLEVCQLILMAEAACGVMEATSNQ